MIARLALLAGAAALIARRRRPVLRTVRVRRISRVVADLDRAEGFYRDALGFRPAGRGRADLSAFGAGAPRADEAVMRLGGQEIALVRFTRPGRRYPKASRSNDLWFQHLAIVVDDMDAAHARLGRVPGWQPISADGPEQLPPENGGVRAFKFRDPDGHPLELLWFPPGQGRAVWHGTGGEGPLGIDHSALAVASTRRSLRFYRALGFRADGRALNHGPAQSRLDGLPRARLDVTPLRPMSDEGPGLELLGYRPPGRAMGATRLNDLVTDWVTLEVEALPRHLRVLRDPDGHRLALTAAAGR